MPDLQRLALVDKFDLKPDPQPQDASFAGWSPDVAVGQDDLGAEIHIFRAFKITSIRICIDNRIISSDIRLDIF